MSDEVQNLGKITLDGVDFEITENVRTTVGKRTIDTSLCKDGNVLILFAEEDQVSNTVFLKPETLFNLVNNLQLFINSSQQLNTFDLFLKVTKNLENPVITDFSRNQDQENENINNNALNNRLIRQLLEQQADLALQYELHSVHKTKIMEKEIDVVIKSLPIVKKEADHLMFYFYCESVISKRPMEILATNLIWVNKGE